MIRTVVAVGVAVASLAGQTTWAQQESASHRVTIQVQSVIIVTLSLDHALPGAEVTAFVATSHDELKVAISADWSEPALTATASARSAPRYRLASKDPPIVMSLTGAPTFVAAVPRERIRRSGAVYATVTR